MKNSSGSERASSELCTFYYYFFAVFLFYFWLKIIIIVAMKINYMKEIPKSFIMDGCMLLVESGN